MAKVPVLRSGWKIDPAELAIAQERTEARLTDLFTHRAPPVGRRPEPHPPIVVDGVQPIDDTELPLAQVDDAAPGGVELDSEPSGVAEGQPVMDVVGVVDSPGAELVDVMLPPSSAGELVGVMDRPGEAPGGPLQLSLVDAPGDAPGAASAASPGAFADAVATPAALPLETVLVEHAEPDLPVQEQAELEPSFDDFAEREPELVSEADVTDHPAETVEAPIAAADLLEGPIVTVGVPKDVIELPGGTHVVDTPEAPDVVTPEAEVAADEAHAVEIDGATRPTSAAASRPHRASKTPATARKGAKSSTRAGKARPPTAARPAATARAAAPASRPPAGGTSVAATTPTVVVAAACPYCALLLEPPPTSSRHCQRCRQQIVVKHIDGRTAYLTEAAVAIFEAERRKESDVGRLTRERERWLKLSVAAGAPPEKASPLAAAQLSQESVDAARQLYLATMDHTFGAAKRDHRWEEAARIRREQAITLHRLAGSPRPPPDDLMAIYQEGVAAELRGLAEIVRDAELASAMCCDACKADNGRVAAISQELAAPALPHQGCPKVFCQCTWDLATRDRESVLRYIRRRHRPAARPAAKH